MLRPDQFDEIEAMVLQGKSSLRTIARKFGVARGTVVAISRGECRRRAGPLALPEDGLPDPDGPFVRCPGCGHRAQMPCLICRLRSRPARILDCGETQPSTNGGGQTSTNGGGQTFLSVGEDSASIAPRASADAEAVRVQDRQECLSSGLSTTPQRAQKTHEHSQPGPGPGPGVVVGLQLRGEHLLRYREVRTRRIRQEEAIAQRRRRRHARRRQLANLAAMAAGGD